MFEYEQFGHKTRLSLLEGAIVTCQGSQAGKGVEGSYTMIRRSRPLSITSGA